MSQPNDLVIDENAGVEENSQHGADQSVESREEEGNNVEEMGAVGGEEVGGGEDGEGEVGGQNDDGDGITPAIEAE